MKRRVRKEKTYSIGEVWSDIDHRFVKDATGGLKKATNIESVYTSIDNIVRTNKGERVMLPQFASDIHRMLFEPLNDESVNFVTDQLKDAIEMWDDRVIIDEISVIREPDNNAVSLEFVFVVKGYAGIHRYQTQIRGDYP